MSDQTDPGDRAGASVLDLLERWYHVPAIVAVLAVMLYSRLRAYGNFIVDGQVYFRGNDAWYHFRETSYLLEHWPNTMPFEAWSGFPFGTDPGHFGTLWDHIIAVFSVVATPITGGGEEGLLRAMLVIAPIVGTAVAIPTYFIARRFVDRLSAVIAVAILGLIPGTFFSQTLVGFPDHHAGEVLFSTLAVLAVFLALDVAEREKPVWELVVDQDWNALKKPIGYAAAAGLAIALYMATWQPGVMLVGFTGIFLVIKITSDVVHEDSPEPIAFVGAVSMGVAGLLMIIPLNEFTFNTTAYSLLQVVLPLGVAVGCAFLAFLARQWDDRDLDVRTYPAAVGGLIVASVGVLAVAVPSAWGTIANNLLRTIAFSTAAATRTIGEAQPPLMQSEFAPFVISQYGFAFFFALAAILYVLARPLIRSDDTRETGYVVAAAVLIGSVYVAPSAYDAIGGLVGLSWQVVGMAIATAFLVGATYLERYAARELYFVVWGLFILAMAFTQGRFNYYLAVVVAVGAGYTFQLAIDALDVRGKSVTAVVDDVQGWQVMILGAVVLVLFAPLVATATPVWAAGANTGPGSVVEWDESLQWMNEETPHPGELEGHDNAMEYQGTYERPEDGDFEYPEGAYGVQSWWDYGHWITTRAERIPNANPFQQNAGRAANFLLAPSEERAQDVLAGQSTEGEHTRYVMVDWQMVHPQSKFTAPVTFYDDGNETQSDFLGAIYQQNQQGGLSVATQVREQRYYESLMVRLYEYHGSAKDPEPVVLNWDQTPVQTADGSQTTVRTVPQTEGERFAQAFNSMSQAESFVENQSGTAQIGGIGSVPTERVDALEQYRLVHATESDAGQYFNAQLRDTQANWVKTFEKVPGATIEGSGAEPGQEVEAAVEMTYPNSNETFVYRQFATADENGEFSFHVPYSTTGYDEYGPENGYTNVSVRATGPYQIGTAPTASNGSLTYATGNATVTEGQVVGENDAVSTVELEEESLLEDDENATDENATDENTTDENTTDGNTTENVTTDDGDATTDGTTDDGGATTDDGNATTSRVAPAALGESTAAPVPAAS
ncbi:dolichyl-diphosphooligosaccharide--protein glycosyltransferase [Halopenitus malekzadehii]|uniref:dolichyl-phosphooligosaccharide-protein glycotransferase n=1 Tax=Halopenitus malekzadehii TaxID=1267564 RepID=A0A1H6IIA6_9EURY|nr:oligosaccharyl transferase, archaeosortase A system-associated [Halopenitus malekzadehii]SEH46254.1 dolichyl-diphosphooligosaccharide--protein glycosyltransferase [Halopenitus malekzadehii]